MLTTTCTECGFVLEPGTAGPCPRCGGIVTQALKLVDFLPPPKEALTLAQDTSRGDIRLQTVCKYDDQPRDNPVSSTLTAPGVNAEIGPDRLPFYNVRVPIRSGETGVVNVCRILIDHLNQDGANWGEPLDLSQLGSRQEHGVDCVAQHLTDPAQKLEIQVTRATRGAIWQRLAEHGVVTDQDPEAHASCEAAAQDLQQSIAHKAKRTPQTQRSSITLALEATDTPWQALMPVVSQFYALYGDWVRQLGFNGIWLVGLIPEVVWRLD